MCNNGKYESIKMKPINEAEAEVLIEEHLRERGWDITDFTVTRKHWRDHLDGDEADRVFLYDGNVVAILEAKKPGKDLWAAWSRARAMREPTSATLETTSHFSLQAMERSIFART